MADRTSANFRYCFYCGRWMPPADVAGVHAPNRRTLEHLRPLSRGGGHSSKNTVFACARCNAAKAAHTVEEYRGEVMVRTGAPVVFWGETDAASAPDPLIATHKQRGEHDAPDAGPG